MRVASGPMAAARQFGVLGRSRNGGRRAGHLEKYQIKAAFLYNFTKFIEWPAEKFPDSAAPIVIGVIGSNPFGTVLADMIKDRKVNGRSIQFREINSVSEVRGLHVLFVPAAETRFGQLAEALREVRCWGWRIGGFAQLRRRDPLRPRGRQTAFRNQPELRRAGEIEDQLPAPETVAKDHADPVAW